jgi:hypothetical protein
MTVAKAMRRLRGDTVWEHACIGTAGVNARDSVCWSSSHVLHTAQPCTSGLQQTSRMCSMFGCRPRCIKPGPATACSAQVEVFAGVRSVACAVRGARDRWQLAVGIAWTCAATSVLLLPAVVTLLIWLGVCPPIPIDSVLLGGPAWQFPGVSGAATAAGLLCHGCVNAMQDMSFFEHRSPPRPGESY